MAADYTPVDVKQLSVLTTLTAVDMSGNASSHKQTMDFLAAVLRLPSLKSLRTRRLLSYLPDAGDRAQLALLYVHYATVRVSAGRKPDGHIC